MFFDPPVMQPSITHLSPEERMALFLEGAMAEVCKESGLFQYVRADGSIYAKEKWIDGKRTLDLPQSVN